MSKCDAILPISFIIGQRRKQINNQQWCENSSYLLISLQFALNIVNGILSKYLNSLSNLNFICKCMFNIPNYNAKITFMPAYIVVTTINIKCFKKIIFSLIM